MFDAVCGRMKQLDTDFIYLPYSKTGWPEFPWLRAGPPMSSALAGLTHLGSLSRASHFYLIGADVLDGHYSNKRTKARLAISNIAVRAGVKTRVVSFSFNETPTRQAIRSMANLNPNIQLVARDRFSALRVEKITTCDVELGADLAFLVSDETLDHAVMVDDGMTIGFVPNSLFAKRFGGHETYVQLLVTVLTALINTLPNSSIALFGHDRRGQDNDWSICRDVADRLHDSRVRALPEFDTPQEVKRISAQMITVVTARMHAAIGSLRATTPPLILGYQGKAAGLLDHFGLDTSRLIVTPETMQDPMVFARAVEDVIAIADELTVQISNTLPTVLAKAEKNFAVEHHSFPTDTAAT